MGSLSPFFFVTGRYEDALERIATEGNLCKVGYDSWNELYMRPDESRADDSVACYKTGAREAIEAKNFHIIANIDDQESDLIGGHAEKTFKVPNPFYFIDGTADSGLGCKPRKS